MALMLHLQGWVGGGAGLLHTLSLVPGPVIWIVIEAGGVTNETASLLTQARVHRLVHLGLEKESTITTPGNSEEQELQLETRLRIEGLRFVHSEVARTETLPFVVGLYSVFMH
jgi:galactosylgalactosylxylosylprotein 3-beta-glucuronosyltransferase 2